MAAQKEGRPTPTRSHERPTATRRGSPRPRVAPQPRRTPHSRQARSVCGSCSPRSSRRRRTQGRRRGAHRPARSSPPSPANSLNARSRIRRRHRQEMRPRTALGAAAHDQESTRRPLRSPRAAMIPRGSQGLSRRHHLAERMTQSRRHLRCHGDYPRPQGPSHRQFPPSKSRYSIQTDRGPWGAWCFRLPKIDGIFTPELSADRLSWRSSLTRDIVAADGIANPLNGLERHVVTRSARPMGCRTIIGVFLIVEGVYQWGVLLVVLGLGGWQAVADPALQGPTRFWIGACSLVCAAVAIPWWRRSRRQ